MKIFFYMYELRLMFKLVIETQKLREKTTIKTIKMNKTEIYEKCIYWSYFIREVPSN